MINNTKRKLVDATCDVLKDMRLAELTPRAVAEAAGCGVDVIFDNYDSMDQLTRVAAIRILDAYAQESQDDVVEGIDALDIDLRLWTNFLQYTFKYPDVFEQLFWGWGKNEVRAAYEAYYDLFPEKKAALVESYTDIFLGTDLRERSIVILQDAADEGLINQQDVPVLATLSVGLLQTIMVSYKGIYRDSALPTNASTEFLTALRSLHEHYRLK